MNKNINCRVSVILTDFGKNILDEHRTEIQKYIPLKFDLTLKYDENGKYTTELWHLMFLFGKYMTQSQKQIFKDNIIKYED